ncbi:MAG: VCBS repeat-containing protein, partial [Cyclobacteriaceae bacterium]|nr:VCBS repeat-containing protein [Cyclobacteriaceae bacterium]
MNREIISVSVFWLLLIVFSGCRNPFEKDKLFKLLKPDDTGIHFNNEVKESYEMNIISYPDFYSGGGVAIGDIDNDGLSDIFFTGNMVPSRLYKNKGNMVFEDITASAKLDRMDRGWYTGTSMVDLNADGYLDIYISKSGMEAPEDRANLLFINNQDGTFSERSKEYGLDNQGFGVNAVFFDYDKDGDLDVYVANQVSSRLNSSDAARLRNVFDDYAGDKLYENIENKFIDVTEKSGMYSSQVGFAHGVAVGDINDDGWEDLFVSNDFFEYDYLYINNGDKTFTESIKKATKHISNFSMGNDLADFNNDGLLDLMVLDMVAEDNRRLYANTGGMNEQRFNRSVQHGLHYQYMFNVLHLNNGNETFSEVGMLAGISRTDWSWAPILADFDNDGLKDLYVTNGIQKDIRNIDWGTSYRNLTQFVANFTEFEESQWDMLLNSMPFEPIQNYMFRNNGDLTFTKVMDDWGLDQKSYSNGVAYGDLDNDGDL